MNATTHFKMKETKIVWYFRNDFAEMQEIIFRYAQHPDRLPNLVWALVKQIARKMNFCFAPKYIRITEAEAYALENILQREGHTFMCFELQTLLNQHKYQPLQP